MTKWKITPILICILILAACSPFTKASGNDVNQDNSSKASTSTDDHSSTVISAEDVVYSFLTAYEDDPEDMILYLDDSLKESLPAGGIQELLNLGSSLNGMVFTKGASAPGTHTAVVEVHIQTDDQVITCTFTLQQKDKTWLITEIK